MFCLTNICINLPSQVYIVPEQTAAIKKIIKSRQKFRLKKMQVQSVFQSLGFFFSSQPFVARRRSEQKARKYSLVFVLSSRPSPLKKTLDIDPRQKQLKLEETDNAIIKSTLSSLWQNFLLFLPQMVVEQEADKLFS